MEALYCTREYLFWKGVWLPGPVRYFYSTNPRHALCASLTTGDGWFRYYEVFRWDDEWRYEGYCTNWLSLSRPCCK